MQQRNHFNEQSKSWLLGGKRGRGKGDRNIMRRRRRKRLPPFDNLALWRRCCKNINHDITISSCICLSLSSVFLTATSLPTVGFHIFFHELTMTIIILLIATHSFTLFAFTAAYYTDLCVCLAHLSICLSIYPWPRYVLSSFQRMTHTVGNGGDKQASANEGEEENEMKRKKDCLLFSCHQLVV